jgi:hypothetical protein
MRRCALCAVVGINGMPRLPAKFGKAELPEIPPGFRYATHVSVLVCNGQRVERYRKLMTVCAGDELQRQGYMKHAL